MYCVEYNMRCAVGRIQCAISRVQCAVCGVVLEKDLYPHHVQKLWEVDCASPILVHCIDQVLMKD